MAPPRALILDYGNVLTLPQAPDVIAAMASRLGATVDAFNAAYWEHRHGYDLGDYTAREYWSRVLTSLRRRTEESDERALLDWLTARDGDSWMRYREPVWEIAQGARTRHIASAMLSNMSQELAAHIRRDRPLERWFGAVIISAEVRCVKPDPRIYRLCLARLAVEPSEALFVDDRPENVRAAAALGMQTVHFTGDDHVAVLRAAVGEGP
ncbi:MAG TPA: HAD family phosphatase [bacterium]|nr:HAD family phosphatase [bacterium]